ncbi:GNAT family N-acetyltransferase [Pantoea sp. YU22]|uniref:GNAT family N-acetyltransferase n=1 Tax=Pantoea TaxID=53335 RepID=UPI000F867923|nr:MULTISPECIES: GNAT family N-acetyltransferase [Pantoea]RTY56586.1 GNAT family N-acetyltransferase [Pantoea sp. YU22]
MKILSLRDAPQFAGQISDWLWLAFDADNSRDFMASVVESSLQEAEFPVTFVAVDDAGRAVGTVGFWRCDLISRQDLFPWLAALYVEESARGGGLSAALQQHVIDYARQRGYGRLWLWSTFGDYYERHGWTPAGEALDYPHKRVRLYRREI